MKNIEKLLKQGEYDKLEKIRKKALSNQNSQLYRELCNELGIFPEDEYLYELGEKIKEKRILINKSQDPFYAQYNLPDKCPQNFWDSFNYAIKVPFKERPNQELVRGVYGEYYKKFYPDYKGNSKKDITQMKKYLKDRFPGDKEDISKLTKKQTQKAYHSIRGVWE